ncbi:unnamed protein product, partial [Echinostoma caproni]|uniref:PH domain-containing protein n=1 Tax=Echinostoma caproni TaxID=27848 RepID=A0A183AMY9_9TREM
NPPRLGNSEANLQRIAAVERLFSFPKLLVPRRVLVGEGVLTKICRRKPKLRHFFLFNDLLLYGRIIVHRKVVFFRNGFSILSPKKSFTVYSSTAEEKAHWIAYLQKLLCISHVSTSLILIAGVVRNELVKHSPVWIPDCEARNCMVCGVTEFTLVHRRVRLFGFGPSLLRGFVSQSAEILNFLVDPKFKLSCLSPNVHTNGQPKDSNQNRRTIVHG